MPLTVHVAVLGIGLSALLAAAVHDILARTIPNLAPAIVTAAGLILRLEDGMIGSAVCAGLLVLAACTLFWRVGWLGGGDAKLLASVAVLLPVTKLLTTLVFVAACGAVLAIPYLIARGRVRSPQPGRRSLALRTRAWRAELFRLRRGGPLPYGAAIAVGVLFSVFGPSQ